MKTSIDLYHVLGPKLREQFDQLNAIADKLQGISKDVAIAKTVGSSVGIAAGVCTIVGLALAPVTAGVSTILMAVGFGVGAAGGITHIGSGVTKICLFKKRKQNVQEILEIVNIMFRELYEALKLDQCFTRINKFSFSSEPENLDLSKHINNIEKCKDMIKAIRSLASAAASKTSTPSSSVVETVGEVLPEALSKTVRKGLIAFAAVWMVLDIIDIGRNAIHLAKGCPTKEAEEIRKVVNAMELKLKIIEDDLENIVTSM